MGSKFVVYPFLISLLLTSALFAAEKSGIVVKNADQNTEAKRAKDLLAKAVDYYKTKIRIVQ